MTDKYDVVVIAGQSNAEGYGLGAVTEELTPNENVLWLNDKSNPRFEKNDQGKDELRLDYPSPFYTSVAEEPTGESGKVGKLAIVFAKMYYQKYLKGTDRKVLIVNSAVGGTGFARNEWGVDNAILYTRLCDMTKYALSLNAQNRLVAFLWHQGECDSVENAHFDTQKRYETHKNNLASMLDDYCAKFDCKSLPIVSAGFCDEWYLKNKENCDAVLKAIKQVVTQRGGFFVETSGLKSNNQAVKNGDDIHFCRESSHVLGAKFFDAYQIVK